MRFRTRMILSYAVFVLMAALILGLAYNRYTIREYKNNEYNDTQFISERLANQFDESIKTMKSITDYILSDTGLLSSIRMLASTDHNNESQASYIEEAKTTIQSGINTDYMIKNFYRVLVFNQYGDVVGSSNYENRLINLNKKTEDLKWLSKVEGHRGKPVLIGIHKDDWGLKSQTMVYSIAREIQGKSMGFIEVQRDVDKLKTLFELPKSGMDVAAVTEDGEILYSTLDGNQNDFYVKLAGEDKHGVAEYRNDVTNNKELIAISNSKETGVKIMVIENMNQLEREIGYVAPLTFVIAGCFFTISMVFVFIVSGHLTKPIQKLREQMENTRIENLDQEVFLDTSNDEMEALSKSYQKVLNRLDESIVKERRLSILQLQAQFDTLQAQVNPHFLYNVLNVIANRGMNSGDETICEICGSLAAMLRYATSTIERYAAIGQELQYLEQYFYLIKSRYEHKLQYHIEVEEEIKAEIIPKIVLQQIVENSINHGFTQTSHIMEIEIKGWKEEGFWYIQVSDNGQGIEDAVLKELQQKITRIRDRLGNRRSNVEMEIGGMGLINTYARLYLLYNEDLVFEINNCDTGAVVKIGGKLKEKTMNWENQSHAVGVKCEGKENE